MQISGILFNNWHTVGPRILDYLEGTGEDQSSSSSDVLDNSAARGDILSFLGTVSGLSFEYAQIEKMELRVVLLTRME